MQGATEDSQQMLLEYSKGRRRVHKTEKET